jgi:hypothetical protein
LADVRTIRALYQSFEDGKPVRVKLEIPEKRPTEEQEIRRPPISKPEMVHAQSPNEDGWRYGDRAKEVAARTVLKEHKQKGHTKGE